ncbi:MAG: hypothetical protein ABIH45_06610 [Candidatus Omnitrophota bacterium]
MKRFKRIFVLFIFFTIFCFIIQVQAYDLAKPPQTEVTLELQDKSEIGVTLIYQYSSNFSKEKIVAFYRSMFTKQGLEEKQPYSQDNPEIEKFIFKKRDIKYIELYFFPSPKGKTNYHLFITDFDKNYWEQKVDKRYKDCKDCQD